MPLYPACEFPLLGDADTIERIRLAVAAREPFSLIRLGDGEAIVLSFGNEMSLDDLSYLQSHWGADGVTLGDVAEVKADLETALSGADLVGIRNDVVDVSMPDDLLERTGSEILNFVVAAFHIRPGERDSLSEIGARRLALLHRVLSRTEFSSEQHFCSAWIHWELLASGALNGILEGVSEVALITSRPELEHLVASRFGTRVSTVIVPDKFVEVPQPGRHVPQRYHKIRSEFTFAEGTLALVGAGIPGKVYCQWLKEAGCVAIDVGSVFDAWVGKASRPRVLESRFNISGGRHVPASLLLHPPLADEERRLNPRWKPTGVAR